MFITFAKFSDDGNGIDPLGEANAVMIGGGTVCMTHYFMYYPEGVEVFPNTLLKGVSLEGGKVKVATQDDREASINSGVWSYQRGKY